MMGAVLDLRGLIIPTMEIIDINSRTWKVAPDLPLRTAMTLLSYSDVWDTGSITQEVFNGTVDGVYHLLKRSNPEATRDDVLDAFSVTDMISLITWVSFQMREGQQKKSNGATPPLMEQTPKPKRSRKKSDEENFVKDQVPS